MNYKQILDDLGIKHQLDENQKKDLKAWFVKLIFLNILDQLYDSLSEKERDELMAASPTEEIKMENIEQTLLFLEKFGIGREKSQELFKKALDFAISKIQE